MPMAPPPQPDGGDPGAARADRPSADLSNAPSLPRPPRRPLWRLSIGLAFIFGVVALAFHFLAGPDVQHSGSEWRFIAELVGGLSGLAGGAATTRGRTTKATTLSQLMLCISLQYATIYHKICSP
jgi:hypothetical protein